MIEIDASSTPATTRRAAWLRRRWLLVLGCYLALSVAYFWPTFVRGDVPLPLMNPYTQGDPAWAGYAPATTATGSNRLQGDVTGFYYPYVVFQIENLRRGEFPLWNPDLYGGIPFFAANQTAQLFPINLISFWFGPYWYWTIAAMLRLLVAGGGMYLLARRLRVSELGALLAGGIYMFAAFQIVWLHFAIHNVAALLPLALWIIAGMTDDRRPTTDDRRPTTDDRRPTTDDLLDGNMRQEPSDNSCSRQVLGSRFSVLALAGVVAAQMFGGHPEMSLFFMVVCGIFACWQVGTMLCSQRAANPNQKRAVRFLGTSRAFVLGLLPIAIACALGLALSAVQWVPTLGLIRTSYTLEERGFAATHEDIAPDYAPLGGLQRASFGNLRHWLLLVAPELWGSPRGDQINYWLDRTNYNEMASYVGLAALPLVALGAWRGADRRAARFFGALFVVSLLLLYPLPGLRLLGFVPPFSIAYGFRFGLGVTLGAAMLAGLGLDALHAAPARTLWRAALAALTLAALNAAIAYDLWNGERVYLALGGVPTPATLDAVAKVWNGNNLRTLVPGLAGGLAALLLALAARGWLARRYALPLLVAVGLAEITVYGYGYNGFTAPEAIYPSTPAIEYLEKNIDWRASPPLIPSPGAILQSPIGTLESLLNSMHAGPSRILNLDSSFWANSAMTHDLQITGGLDDLVPGNQGRFVKRGMAGVVPVGDKYVLMEWGQRLTELMNVRYIASHRPIARYKSKEPLPLELQDRNLYIYRNNRALPRAYAATAVVLAAPRDAENAVFDARFDPHRAVVLEAAPAGFAPTKPAPVKSVPVVSYTPDRVELAPNLRATSIVVLADAYDPDWHVTVDGQTALLLRANALFRGVVVPAGQHRVVFTYRPHLVEWSGLVSGAALLLCAAWVALASYQGKQNAKIIVKHNAPRTRQQRLTLKQKYGGRSIQAQMISNSRAKHANNQR